MDDGAVADQADDFERSGAAGTNEGIRFVHFHNQPGPRTRAVARELLAAVGIILVRPLRSGRLSACRGGSPSRNPARIGKGAVVSNQLWSRIRDARAPRSREVRRREDAGRGGIRIAAPAALAAVVDDLAGFRAIVQALDGERPANLASYSRAGVHRVLQEMICATSNACAEYR